MVGLKFRTVNGKTYTLDVSPETTVLEMKQELARLHPDDLSPHRMKMLLFRKVLQDLTPAKNIEVPARTYIIIQSTNDRFSPPNVNLDRDDSSEVDIADDETEIPFSHTPGTALQSLPRFPSRPFPEAHPSGRPRSESPPPPEFPAQQASESHAFLPASLPRFRSRLVAPPDSSNRPPPGFQPLDLPTGSGLPDRDGYGGREDDGTREHNKYTEFLREYVPDEHRAEYVNGGLAESGVGRGADGGYGDTGEAWSGVGNGGDGEWGGTVDPETENGVARDVFGEVQWCYDMLSEEEKATVNRLAAGRPDAPNVIQIFMACEKNEAKTRAILQIN